MHALQLTAQGLALRSDYPQPQVAPHEARLAVRLAGICTTDLELMRGYMPAADLVLGHEFVGQVECCPSRSAWEGRRVVGEINVGCRHCADCQRGHYAHCTARACLGILKHDGAFAEYLTLPLVNLHPVPRDMPDRVAVFTEPVAAALRIQEQVALPRGMNVAVVGDGKLGLLIAMTLQSAGHHPHAFGRHARKLAVLERLGIEGTVVRPGTEDAWQARLRGRYPMVVECAGSASACAMAQALVEPEGTLILKSTKAQAAGSLDLNALVVNEIRVLGSRCGPFGEALAWLERQTARGRFPVDDLIDATMPLTDGMAAVEAARQSGSLKVLLRP